LPVLDKLLAVLVPSSVVVHANGTPELALDVPCDDEEETLMTLLFLSAIVEAGVDSTIDGGCGGL
jgi:hypothetical protein